MPQLFAVIFAAFALSLTRSTELAGNFTHHVTISLPEDLCVGEVNDVTSLNNDNQDDTAAAMRLAVCLHRNNHPAAVDLYQRIRRFKPDFSYVLVNLAVIAAKSGDTTLARQYLEQYLAEVGGPYGGPCRHDSNVKLDCVNALNNLGALEFTDGKNASAATFFLIRAIEIGDDNMLVNTYSNLGGHLAKMGDQEGAADAFLRGFWISRQQGLLDVAAGLLVRRAFLVPTVAASLEETRRTRLGFQRRIRDVTEMALHGGASWLGDESDLFRVAHGVSKVADIRKIPRLFGVLSEWTTNIQLPPFYAHYYGWHDLPLNTAVADMFSLLCPASLFEVAGHLARTKAGNTHRKRVGFVSSLIGGDEPHGLLIVDILRSNLRDLFDFFVVSIGSKPLTTAFSGLATTFQVGYDEVRARHVLRSLELDCLVYAESMNDPIVHFLGYQRFAEVQVLLMGRCARIVLPIPPLAPPAIFSYCCQSRYEWYSDL